MTFYCMYVPLRQSAVLRQSGLLSACRYVVSQPSLHHQIALLVQGKKLLCRVWQQIQPHSEDPAGKCLSWPQCERAGLVSQVLIRVYPRAHIFDVDPD